MPKIPKNRAKVDRDGRPRSASTRVEEACALVKKAKFAKFDETVDLAVRLGVNPKHADQMVRGAIVLPHGTGQTVRVLVFAKGEKEREARRPAPTSPAATTWSRRSHEGFMDFDRVIATPDMMGAVGKLGRVLGPRGLMPNPKVGTVTFDVGERRQRGQGRQDRVPRREGGHRPRPHRQGLVQREGAHRQRERAHHRRSSARSPRPRRAPTSGASRSARRWAPACKIDPLHFVGQDRGGITPWIAPRKTRRSARSRRRFDKMTSAVFLDFKGMTVEHVTEAPRRVPQGRRRVQGRQEHARQARAQGHAVRRASSTTCLVGMTGIAWSYEDPSAAAKVVKAFRKDPAGEKLQIKAGLIEGSVLDAKGRRGPARDDARQGRAPRHAARDAPGAAPAVRRAAPRSRAELRLRARRRKSASEQAELAAPSRRHSRQPTKDF